MTGDRFGKGPKGHDAIREIARRLGSIVEAVDGAIQSGGTGEEGRDFSIDTPVGPLTGRFGVTVKPAGAGARRPTRHRPVDDSAPSPTSQEPLIDSFDEADEVVVTADIPGLRIEDVTATCEAGYLNLVIGGKVPLSRRLAFAALTVEHTPQLRVTNGILEIRIPKTLAT